MSTFTRVLLTLVIVTMLMIIPLPSGFLLFRPAFVFLTWFYIRLYHPEYFSMPLLILHGLVLDTLLFTTLGLHAFSMILVFLMINNRAYRLRFSSIVQQMFLVSLLTLSYLGIQLIISKFIKEEVSFLQPLCAAFTTSLLWPWLKISLDDSLQPEVRT